MKHFYLFFCLLFCGLVNGQIINFPDANFKAKLMQPYVAVTNNPNDIYLDSNNDGELEVSEVDNVWQLDVSNANISDLTGIEYFTSLKYLNCNNNLLTTISILAPTALSMLYANHNALTSVSVNWDSFKEGLDLSYNNLTSYTIESGTYYETVNLSHNQLTSLVIDNATFEFFSVSHNNLTTIQVNGTTSAYSSADFRNNQFSLLDLSLFSFNNECDVFLGNNMVDRVLFSENYIQPGNIYYNSNNTFFDLGNFRMITSCDPEDQGHLSISNSPNLEYVILKNGFNHTTVSCNEGGDIFQNPALSLSIWSCPNLSFICVDDGERPNIQSRINQLGLQNQVQVNSYCTFTPGGIYYTVSGETKFDFNANGCDINDFPIPYQEFTITNGSETGTIISDASGNYTLNVGFGTHTITPVLENSAAFAITPANVTVNFPTQNSPLNQNFCLSAGAAIHDFDITLIPLSPAVSGFDANYKIVYKNTGNTIDSGMILLNFPDATLDFVAASITPTAILGGALSWSFANLLPFETRTINLTFNLNSPMETPPLNSNDVLSYTTSISETDAAIPYLNTHSLNQTVVNSFDPNDKICLEGESLSNDFIGNYVSYRIRFENTGTFPAQNIVVKDVIDATKFDISTLTPITGSHSFFTRITGNTAEFIFENINLPFDDSINDGYLVFKIKLLPSVIQGVTFSNQASIFFDYNFPIVTNTTSSVIAVLGQNDFEADNLFTIHPVPAKNILHIETMDNLDVKAIEIYNNLGQIVQKEIGNKQTINVSRLAKGSYYLKIKTDDSSYSKQFLKE
ncbi:DUF7619 domain-containing protein [Flavobacterium sp. UBA7682]|uniref:DUF7619 domain-containing protein n=1 Tax=Flavobacterium sp. UBA7682 TaxID=1946560 RepID=UPI0025B7D5C4|nr:T9SS type A sorting domain-containing protein [Flavobacterium sp. UBA7682]